MFVKHLEDCEEFIAGDNSILREVLHPKNDKIKIGYSIAYAKVKPGETTYLHKLKSSEVYFILSGEGEIYVDGEQKKVFSGHVVYIPPNSTQKIRNVGNTDLEFLCIVYPAWKVEDEEILE